MKWFNLIITTLCLYAALMVSPSRSEGPKDDTSEQLIRIVNRNPGREANQLEKSSSEEIGSILAKGKSGSIISSATTLNKAAKIMDNTSKEKLNKISYNISDIPTKTIDESELNHLNDSSINKTKDTDANLEQQTERNDTYVDGEKDLKDNSTDNSDKSQPASSNSSFNETEIVFVDDDEKVEDEAEELEETLEKFEAFEAGLSNSSNVNDSKNVGDTTKKIMNNADIDGTKNISPQVSQNEISTNSTEPEITGFMYKPIPSNISMENIEGKKDDATLQIPTTTEIEFDIMRFFPELSEDPNISTETFEETEVAVKTTEPSVTKFLTPKLPEARSIPINGFNEVKDDGTNSTEPVSTIDIPDLAPSEEVEIVANDLQTEKPVEDIENNDFPSLPVLTIDEPVLAPSEEVKNKLQSVQEKAIPLPVDDSKTESVLNSTTTNAVESKLPSEKDLKIDTAKIDPQTNDTSSTNSSTTEEDKRISDESRQKNSSEDVSLTNDFKKNESSIDTDFYEIHEVPPIHEVIETLSNENSTSEDTVVCPKGYRCIPLNQTSHEVCLSFTNVYVVAGSVTGFLLLAVIAIYLKLRRRNSSSSLYDIPHLNIKSDYNLTPIPRPTITHPDREYVPSFGTETYSRPRGEESVLSQRHFNDTLPDEFMELKNVPSNTRLHTFGRSASRKSNANSACNEYYSLDTWKDKEPLRKQGSENLAFRKW